MTGAARYQAVTFDFWHTLVTPVGEMFRSRRLEALAAATRAAGGDHTDEQIESAFAEVFTVYQRKWEDNEQFTAADGIDHLAADLGVELDRATRDELVTVFEDPGDDVLPEVVSPEVGEVLATLARSGLRLGIICDVGLTPSRVLRRYLEAHTLLDHFDHWSFSDEVGVYKPHGEIFAHALAGLGDVDPASAVHVGDLCRTDVAGARAAGMTSVRYRRANDDIPAHPGADADHVIDDHAELLALIGL